MKKNIKSLIDYSIAIIGVLISGCSSAVHIQKADTANLNKYKTYAWVHSSANENDSSKNTTMYADIAVQNTVNAELKEVGWSEDTTNPDVFICYDILVEKSSERVPESVYSRPFRRFYYNPYYDRWGSIYYPSEFLGYEYYSVPVKEGTLTISIMDAKTDKLIWQGWTRKSMNYARLSENEVKWSAKKIIEKLELAQK